MDTLCLGLGQPVGADCLVVYDSRRSLRGEVSLGRGLRGASGIMLHNTPRQDWHFHGSGRTYGPSEEYASSFLYRWPCFCPECLCLIRLLQSSGSMGGSLAVCVITGFPCTPASAMQGGLAAIVWSGPNSQLQLSSTPSPRRMPDAAPPTNPFSLARAALGLPLLRSPTKIWEWIAASPRNTRPHRSPRQAFVNCAGLTTPPPASPCRV